MWFAATCDTWRSGEYLIYSGIRDYSVWHYGRRSYYLGRTATFLAAQQLAERDAKA
jgi:hypothetical protein